MKKLIFLTISFMISCISVYSQPTAPWSGDGTTGKPYLINNIVDLQYLADQTYLDWYGGDTFKLTANIGTLSVPVTFTIGPFSGTFDGSGHTITYSFDAMGFLVTGLFYSPSGLSVSNLKVTGSIYNIDRGNISAFVSKVLTTPRNYYFTRCTSDVSLTFATFTPLPNNIGFSAGFIGEINSAANIIFDSCLNNTSFVIYRSHLGGVIGCYQNMDTLKLNACVNTGLIDSGYISGGGIGHAQSGILQITNFNNYGCIGGKFSGGVVGLWAGSQATLSGCQNHASATISSDSIAGGIVAYNCTTVALSNCVNNGTVEGTYYAGGMLALSKGTATLTNCVNNGNITSDNGTAGGLVGVSTGAVTFTNCQNYGNVTGITAAGICGNIASTSGIVKPFYSDLTNYGNITSTGGRAAGVLADLSISYGNITLSNLRNFGNVTGSGDVAGIISYLQVDSAYITNCVNNGDISGSDSTVSGIIGKIAGKTLYAEISDCKNAGTIKTNENQIVQYMGGIIAAAPDTFCVAISPTCNFNTAKDHDNRPLFNDRVTCTKLQISNCTNIGKILGSSSTYVGGIIGLFNYTTDKGITNCVNSGIIGGGANAGGITGSIYNYDTIAGFFSVNINKCINTNWVAPSSNSGGIFGSINHKTLIHKCNVIFKIEDCFYDNQMCIVGEFSYLFYPWISISVVGFSTDNMVNLQVPGWITNPLFYPAPMLSHPVDLLASAPIYLQDKDNLSNITTSSFKLSNINTYGNSSRTPHVWGNYTVSTNKDTLFYNNITTNSSVQVRNIDYADAIALNGWDTLGVRLIDRGMIPANPVPLNNLEVDEVWEKAVPFVINNPRYQVDIIIEGCNGGWVKPSRLVNIPIFSDTTFVFGSSNCCILDAVFLDDVPVQLVLDSLYNWTYTLTNIISDHTIRAQYSYLPPVGITSWRYKPYDEYTYPHFFYNYEPNNRTVVEFAVTLPDTNLKFPPIDTTDYVLYKNNGRVINVVRDTVNVTTFYVIVETVNSITGNNLGMNGSDTVRIDSVLYEGSITAIDKCYNEFYDIRRSFVAPELLYVSSSFGLISFNDTVKLLDSTGYRIYFVSSSDTIYVDSTTFTSPTITFYFNMLLLDSLKTYHIEMHISPAIFRDKWDNFNIDTVYDLGEFSINFLKSSFGDFDILGSCLSVGAFIPNPSTGLTEFYITPLEDGNISISIYTMSGNLVMEVVSDLGVESGKELLVPLSLGRLQGGIYTVVISMDSVNVSRQVIIIK